MLEFEISWCGFADILLLLSVLASLLFFKLTLGVLSSNILIYAFLLESSDYLGV